jgi:hypothetical protein
MMGKRKQQQDDWRLSKLLLRHFLGLINVDRFPGIWHLQAL